MQFVLKQPWDLLVKKHGFCTMKSKRLMFRLVKNSSDLPTGQLLRKLSNLGQIAIVNTENTLWTAAHLST